MKKLAPKITLIETKGFTLVELMITLLLSSIVLAAISTAYQTQQRSQTILSQRIGMQQQLRSLITFISSEIRLTGLDPQEDDNVGISQASQGGFRFTLDVDDDGLSTGANEDIEYGFPFADDNNDDGQADIGAASFCRRRANVDSTELGFESLADNIVAVEFLYVLEDSSDNDQYDPTTTLTPSTPELEDIRAITISILIRTANPDSKYDNNETYVAASGQVWGPYDDNYRRMLLTTNVKLRNIGL
ncbi:MAG: type IV pilus assembly protein PilW [Desulforhopalus sp.]|jgi:type IV pilus assembly protein PilW